MKISIIGSRSFNDYDLVEKTITKTLDISLIDTVVSGGAKGADFLGEIFAKNHNLQTMIFLPDWEKHGKKAGFLRNSDIIKNSDHVFAFWDGESKGTYDSITKAKKANKPITIVQYAKE